MPLSRKTDGLRTDAFWASTPSPTAYDRIPVPTLILSVEDDLFRTAESARLLAELIPDARLVIYAEGGHIWLRHDRDIAEASATLIRSARG